MISMRYRDVLPSYVADEFDSLIAQLKAWALEEHDEEGHHIVNDRDLAFVAVGATMGWLTATPPSGWLIMQGQQVNRVTYKALFDLWGTTYGVGDGSTTFNIPDLRGRFFLSKAASGTGNTLGATGGALDHTHSVGSHTHSAGSLASASHTHSIASHTHGIGTIATASGGSHDHGGETGIDDDNDNIQNGTGAALIISLHPHSHTIDSSGAHTHTMSGSTASGGSGSTGSDGGGSVTGSTGSASAGTSGAENPAYFVGNTIVFTGVAA